jgi:hypothetical protein
MRKTYSDQAVDFSFSQEGKACVLDAVDVQVLVLGEAPHPLPVHKVEPL